MSYQQDVGNFPQNMVLQENIRMISLIFERQPEKPETRENNHSGSSECFC